MRGKTIKIPLKAGHHWPTSETPWWPNIEFWPSSFAIFQGIRTSFAKKTIFCDLSGVVRTTCRLPPLDPPMPVKKFSAMLDVSWVEPVLNRVKPVLHKETIWCLQRDSNKRPLYLKSSTLPLVDSTGIIQLFGHCIATCYAMSQSHLKFTEIWTSCGRD